METALVNTTLLTGKTTLENQAVVLEAGAIKRLCSSDKLADSIPVTDLNGQLLCPGFIDTQVK